MLVYYGTWRTENGMMSLGLLGFLYFLCVHLIAFTHAFIPIKINSNGISRSACHVGITSALEELIKERQITDRSYRNIHLLTFDSDGRRVNGTVIGTEANGSITMPIYPLQAVYLPSSSNGNNTHILRNTEPRNIKMAMDLLDLPGSSNRAFCAVFCCADDTGRWASVGTVMRILDAEPQKDADGNLARVILTCQTEEELVNIIDLANPKESTSEARILRRNEYIRGRVQLRGVLKENESDESGDSSSALVEKLTTDYAAVRNFYLNGVGTSQLPPFSLDRLEESLPVLIPANLTHDFWEVAQLWQTLCYTIREGRQISLNSDRNELLVTSAIRAGGPLQLPIHVSDVSPEDRQAVAQLEQDAQKSWLDTRLDPTLDFLSLIVQPTMIECLEVLATMVSRERDRLTRLALLAEEDSVLKREAEDFPRKGAWFE